MKAGIYIAVQGQKWIAKSIQFFSILLLWSKGKYVKGMFVPNHILWTYTDQNGKLAIMEAKGGKELSHCLWTDSDYFKCPKDYILKAYQKVPDWSEKGFLAWNLLSRMKETRKIPYDYLAIPEQAIKMTNEAFEHLFKDEHERDLWLGETGIKSTYRQTCSEAGADHGNESAWMVGESQPFPKTYDIAPVDYPYNPNLIEISLT